MKKYLSILFLTVLIIPSVAFASWWNPFSWNIFHRTNTKTQIIENKMPEPISKNSNATTTTSTSSPKTVIKIVPTNSTAKKVETASTSKVVNITISTPKETPDQFCARVFGINSMWNGTESNDQSNKICSCKTGYQWNDGQTQCISVPVVPSPYVNPKTGAMYTPEEFVKNADAKCASQDKVRSTTINSDGTVDCITYIQSCQNEFGPGGVYSGQKDINGSITCACKSGYALSSDQKSCQIQQQNNNPDPYGVLYGTGINYSPEELNAIDCAYYGRNCSKTNTVQINNYYQTPPPATQTQTINCSNYQTEKNNLDQYYADHGTLFSGARASAENALQAKYASCF